MSQRAQGGGPAPTTPAPAAKETDPVDPGAVQALRRELAPAARVALLLVHQEGVETAELVAGRPLVVGREPPADLHVADGTLSRSHASFCLRPDRAHVDVADLGSMNGTWVGDRRVDRAVLSVGEEAMLGGVLARLRLVAAPPAPDAGGAGPALIAGPALSGALRTAERAARSRITVLLQGETGSGKEVFARHIHAASPRAAMPMVSVNCGAVPRELIESTFFGHERGAFTGAHQARRGVFESADGGTVFLDEIGELEPPAQVALLRVLETGRITRVGASEERAVDVRVVAATHRDLAAMVEAERFREDLYFRLSAVTMEIPPLRQRREDVAPLARSLLAGANRAHGRQVEDITPGALARLSAYAWPGNVRELKNVIERAVVLAEGDVIDENDLPDRIARAEEPAPAARGVAQAGGRPAAPSSRPSGDSSEIAHPGGRPGAPSDSDLAPAEQRLRARVQAYEADIIRDALARAGGSRSEAARMLGMPLRTLAHRIKALGIDEDE